MFGIVIFFGGAGMDYHRIGHKGRLTAEPPDIGEIGGYRHMDVF
jgi:hypothetical protein